MRSASRLLFQSCRSHGTVRIGDKATITKTFTLEDVQCFSRISEDNNAIHHNLEAAQAAGFDGVVVHGVLCMGLLSATIGTQVG